MQVKVEVKEKRKQGGIAYNLHFVEILKNCYTII
jgi:hypothetical protein